MNNIYRFIFFRQSEHTKHAVAADNGTLCGLPYAQFRNRKLIPWIRQGHFQHVRKWLLFVFLFVVHISFWSFNLLILINWNNELFLSLSRPFFDLTQRGDRPSFAVYLYIWCTRSASYVLLWTFTYSFYLQIYIYGLYILLVQPALIRLCI